jgi:hypothetical protein
MGNMDALLKILLLIVFVQWFGMKCLAQTFDNYQFYESDQTINPAHTGMHPYEWRVYNHYFINKTIAPKGYSSFYLGGDYAYSLFPNKLSVGAYFKSENLGSSPVVINQYFISASFHFRIKQSKVGIGVQPGVYSATLDMDQLVFPDQYSHETGGFTRAVPTLENIWIKPENALLLNAGITIEIPIGGNAYTLGLAQFMPGAFEATYYESTLTQHTNITASTSLHLNRLSVKPNFWMQLSPVFVKYTIGAFIDYPVSQYNKSIQTLIAGAQATLKTNDYPNALSFIFGLQWKKVIASLNYTYPYNFNDNKVHQFNTFELVLVINGFNAQLNQFILPCEFY